MNLLIKNVRVVDGVTGEHPLGDVLVVQGIFARFAKHISMRGTRMVDAHGGYLTPGIVETALTHALTDPHYTGTTQMHLSQAGVTTLMALQPNYSTNPAAAQDALSHRLRTGMHINIAPAVSALFTQEAEYPGAVRAKAIHYHIPPHADPEKTIAALKQKIGAGERPLSISLLPTHTQDQVGAIVALTREWARPVIIAGAANQLLSAEDTHYTLTNPTRTRLIPAAAFIPQWMTREYDRTADRRLFSDKKNQARIAQVVCDMDPRNTYVAVCASRPYWVGYSIANLVQRLGSAPKAVIARVVAADPAAVFATKNEALESLSMLTPRTILTSGAVAVEQAEYAPATFAHEHWAPKGFSIMRALDASQQKNVIAAYSSTPARLCGLQNRGRIAPGYWADFQLFDEQWNLRSVFVNGHSVAGDHIEVNKKPGSYLYA